MARRRPYGRSYSNDFYYFPPSRPIEAKGGIKAQSKRGGFGESWWAKRWIAVLESFNMGARLGRGRSYARRGQVLSIDIEKGLVKAQVQGSRPKPYAVTIKTKTLGKVEWIKLAKVLSQQAIFAARLLAGEMPRDIEEAFKKAGLALFPEKIRELDTDCSCPDYANPCKHIAAVYYLIGEEFDRDPFLMLKLRGIDREELVGMLGARPAAKAEKQAGKAAVGGEAAPAEEPRVAPEPLPVEPEAFWGTTPREEADAAGEARIPAVAAALPKRLGKFPFWRGEDDFLTTLEAIYRAASPKGLEVFVH